MATVTPRRSTRTPHNHTPKMSERKKGLFQSSLEPSRESLTKHRLLAVLDSESDSEECDLGIISTLDSSSGDENDIGTPKTPERKWHETRSQTRKLMENQELKSFIKSPFMLNKFQPRYSCSDSRCTGSVSTPATPHLQYHPGTPSSTHSCASAHTTPSTTSRARKSLASLIADTESCSSSLKDLTFDTDSGTDSKENTPTKVRRSNRRSKMTPEFSSFKGILVEQSKNSPMKGVSPIKQPIVSLTKMDMTMLSPSQMLKTPQTTEAVDSPPKLGHSRRSMVLIGESPDSACNSEKSHKRLRNESLTEQGPNPKHPRLENAPKARLSLFNSERLKEILSTKSFYGKSNPELNKSVAAKISNAIEVSTVHRKSFTHSHSSRRKRKPGQINMGVRHKIRKPKHQKSKLVQKYNGNNTSNSANSTANSSMLNSTLTNGSKDISMTGHNSSQDLTADKVDIFVKEKETIEALLSQWEEEEEEIPGSELFRPELPCFNSTVIEATNSIFQPLRAVPVTATNMPKDSEAVIVELGAENVSLPPQGQGTIHAMSVPQTVTTPSNQNMTLQTLTIPESVTTLKETVTTLQETVTTFQQTVTTLQQTVATMPQAVTTLPDVTVTTVPQAQDVVMEEAETHESHHGSRKNGQFLPVEGGFILVEENGIPTQEDLPDLDEIERELKMLDEQILQMAQTNNINAEAVLASTETGLPVTTNDASSPLPADKAPNDKPTKLFPIFSHPNPGSSTPRSKGEKSKKSLLKSGSDQYVIDAGQKRFGATQCAECGAIYQIGDPQDEHDHLVHHNATDVLKFNGWKDEDVIERGANGDWRVVRARAGSAGWRRVDTLLRRVVHPQLGCEGGLQTDHAPSLTAYLYVEKKQIVGCLIAETKTKAYKLIPGDPDCCSVEDYPVKCGISRIWTHLNHRRRGVAKRLLDCARASFLYGAALTVAEVAFSAPTASGKALATKYCGTDNFYVYLD